MKFYDFANLHKYLNINELIDFYSVFDDFFVEKFEDDLYINIKEKILKNYENINLSYDDKTNYALYLLAKNDRKKYSINKKINHFKANSIINNLINSKIIKIEKTKEKKLVKNKRQKIKKELRAYTAQDKIIFKDNFTRFFFRFLKPNEKLLLDKKYDEVLELIKKDFEHYQSFCFEQISKEFLERKFKINNISSYWDKNIELDLYYKDEKISFIGEVKFKNKKICKNILNILKQKAKYLKIDFSYHIIISKNGFSNEIKKIKEQNLLLYDLKDFENLRG